MKKNYSLIIIVLGFCSCQKAKNIFLNGVITLALMLSAMEGVAQEITITPSPLIINVPVNGTGSGILNISNAAFAPDLKWVNYLGQYEAITSDMPGGPVFGWDSDFGTALNFPFDPDLPFPIDDDAVEVSLPFAFPFFGHLYNSVWISSNGLLTFGAGWPYSIENNYIPSNLGPTNVISPFWDDLAPNIRGSIYYNMHPDRIVVTYSDVPTWNNLELNNSFQVILYQNGSILFGYQNMQYVSSATVGIGNELGTEGLFLAFNDAFIHSNMAIQINPVLPVCPWITSLTPSSGTTVAGSTSSTTVAVNATGLVCGTSYNCNIKIINNSTNAPQVMIPVTLNVGNGLCSIASVPTDNTYTGGIPTNLYIGYGPQSTTLQVSAPICGAPYTYSWSGGLLSNYNTANPVFTATTPGTFTFMVHVTNINGYNNTCSITINVYDVRVPGSKGMKVYLCHLPPSNPAKQQTIAVANNTVPSHIPVHPGDHLGACDLIATLSRSLIPVKDVASVANNWIAYPNPNKGSFDIQLNNRKAGNVEIRILSMTGALIERRSVYINSKQQVIHFNLKSQSVGTYYGQIISNEGIQSFKFMLSR